MRDITAKLDRHEMAVREMAERFGLAGAAQLLVLRQYGEMAALRDLVRATANESGLEGERKDAAEAMQILDGELPADATLGHVAEACDAIKAAQDALATREDARSLAARIVALETRLDDTVVPSDIIARVAKLERDISKLIPPVAADEDFVRVGRTFASFERDPITCKDCNTRFCVRDVCDGTVKLFHDSRDLKYGIICESCKDKNTDRVLAREREFAGKGNGRAAE